MMSKFTDLLLELQFDASKTSKYTWKKISDTVYEFNTSEDGTESGIDYEVIFDPHDEVTFERKYKPKDKGYDLTGEGKAFKINATVMDITLDFMKNNKNWHNIIISPINYKRLNIVRKFIDNSIPKDKYFVDEEEGILTITRKLYKFPKQYSKIKKPYAA